MKNWRERAVQFCWQFLEVVADVAGGSSPAVEPSHLPISQPLPLFLLFADVLAEEVRRPAAPAPASEPAGLGGAAEADVTAYLEGAVTAQLEAMAATAVELAAPSEPGTEPGTEPEPQRPVAGTPQVGEPVPEGGGELEGPAATAQPIAALASALTVEALQQAIDEAEAALPETIAAGQKAEAAPAQGEAAAEAEGALASGASGSGRSVTAPAAEQAAPAAVPPGAEEPGASSTLEKYAPLCAALDLKGCAR